MAKRETFNSFNNKRFVLADILLANGDELNLNLAKFPGHFYPFFSREACCCFHLVFLERSCQYFCILTCKFLPEKATGLDAGLDGKI